MTCLKVIYSGKVQGVGFRMTACQVASGFDVTGTVKNLPDRTVELWVEGKSEEVAGFLNKLAKKMALNIHHQTASEQPNQKFIRFSIKY